MKVNERPDLPSIDASADLARWLSGPRGRLLRRAHIGRCRRVLELGCGHGIITAELVRRSAGTVIALDRRITSLLSDPRMAHVNADAGALPFAPHCFDLIFAENVLMWVSNAEETIRQAARCLEPGGALVAIEPDYGGMIEHPPDLAVQDLWVKGLSAAGADPRIGRKLPGICEAAGLDTWVELQNIPQPATPEATRLLLDLPLADEEKARAEESARAIGSLRGKWQAFIHVPYFLIVATRS